MWFARCASFATSASASRTSSTGPCESSHRTLRSRSWQWDEGCCDSRARLELAQTRRVRRCGPCASAASFCFDGSVRSHALRSVTSASVPMRIDGVPLSARPCRRNDANTAASHPYGVMRNSTSPLRPESSIHDVSRACTSSRSAAKITRSQSERRPPISSLRYPKRRMQAPSTRMVRVCTSKSHTPMPPTAVASAYRC